jgi:hypothetical protein
MLRLSIETPVTPGGSAPVACARMAAAMASTVQSMRPLI